MTIEDILKNVPLFDLLPPGGVEELVKQGQTLSIETGQVVCEEGEESQTMYVILEGQLRVFKQDNEENEVEINILKSGDFFGEMALLDSRPRSATVISTTSCRLFMLEKLAFMRLLLNPETQLMALSVFEVLVQRVRVMMEKYFDDELAQRTLQAEMEAERHRSLAQMVADMAQELNTPLESINTATDTIAKRVQSDQLKAALGDDQGALAILEEMQEATQLADRNIKQAHKLMQDFKKISVSQLADN